MAISGIHTHSGPGGYLQYVLYDITSLGFVRQSFDALVDGIVEVRSQAISSTNDRWRTPKLLSLASVFLIASHEIGPN